MRGPGDQMTIGERVRFYRRRRGLTQEVLANLVGRKVDWLNKIERGERDLRRLDVVSDVARALRVTVADLFGQPVLMEDDEENDDVPALRDALMTPRRLSRTLFGAVAAPVTVNPEASSHFVEQAWDAYQAGRLGRVVTSLPGLIETAQQLEDAAVDGDQGRVRVCWSVSARAHHLAATALSKLGEVDLAWIAAERAMHAADSSGGPLVLASAARAGTHALLAVGRFDDAVALGGRAASWLTPQMARRDPAALSLYGMLHLRTAIGPHGVRIVQPLRTCYTVRRAPQRSWAKTEITGKPDSDRQMLPCTGYRRRSIWVTCRTLSSMDRPSWSIICRWNDKLRT